MFVVKPGSFSRSRQHHMTMQSAQRKKRVSQSSCRSPSLSQPPSSIRGTKTTPWKLSSFRILSACARQDVSWVAASRGEGPARNSECAHEFGIGLSVYTTCMTMLLLEKTRIFISWTIGVVNNQNIHPHRMDVLKTDVRTTRELLCRPSQHGI